MTIETIVTDFSYDEIQVAFNADLAAYYCLLSYVNLHDDEDY